jgi:competence protein ComEC
MRSLAPRIAVLTLLALLIGTARLQAIDGHASGHRPPMSAGTRPGARGGLGGALDGIRDRAAAALGRGMPDREANLARGFVLGQDQRIDAATVRDFKRSGLAHLLAVSGENVMLLALLAVPLLGLAGLGLRARLYCVLALIAIYVPVTGAGPSIQRAGVMGALGVIATLAGRRRSRVYAITVAALATLAWDPRVLSSASWQLSFAAVIGIALWAAPLARWLGGADPGPVRRALAEGAGVTIAAGLATAPLMAHHFEAVSAATLPANLLALPAVAPAMWLGMLTAMAGQLAAVPVEPLNWLNSLLLAYIAQVAHWFSTPSWALVPARLSSWGAVACSYAAMAIALRSLDGVLHRRRAMRPRPAPRRGRRALLAVGPALLGALLLAGAAPAGAPPRDRPGLTLDFLDVGQGDAILLRPSDGGAVLVDGGPPGDDLAAKLAAHGVHGLAAAIVTHDQADHAGGLEELFGRLPIDRLLYGDRSAPLLALAARRGVASASVGEGSVVQSGSLRLQVLWPPPAPAPEAGADPNLRAVVILARWRGFSALLTADAEAESVPVDPGPVDVLKVAHHGSADAGLGSLLDHIVPRLAVILVGAHNSYGHPAAETLATLERHRVPVLRTDRDGTVEVTAGAGGWTVNHG